MTEINTHRVAKLFIHDAVNRADHSHIRDWLGGLSEDDRDVVADEISELIDKATVTITFPEAE